MLPVQVVRHASSVSFRLMIHHKKEVERWLNRIEKQFGFTIQCGAPPQALCSEDGMLMD